MARTADTPSGTPPGEGADRAPTGELTLGQVAARAGVSTATVRRWVKDGLVPQYEGEWTPAAASHVRIVARLRERGHTVQRIREASQSGKLAFGYIDELLPSSEARYTLREAGREIGLEPELIERLVAAMGQNALSTEEISEEDLQVLRYGAEVLAAGFPLPALLQLVRVYGQAMAQVADAEVRLFHLYLHEPLMRDGVPGVEVAQAMEGMTREMLPFAVPFINYLHGRLLGYFVEQDVIGHIESDLDDEETAEEGRMRVAIAFADLAGYTKLTEEAGEARAVSAVERFVETVEQTLPIDARVIKTLGDEVMVVGADAGALTGWAVGLQGELPEGSPPPRIGIHSGAALYRDGDYYGREVNRAARVVARAAGGEVLVTHPVVEAAGRQDGLEFELIGEVVLKGFNHPTELFLARARGD
ncbi:MAG TPA: adenylate/guanylate cyclase domain-containing protein [Solirubrobacteraceae bacterium]|nr:adenylate/guanylate cyclase domain-containing protein [Solirubrobacteraceae bacterium]